MVTKRYLPVVIGWWLPWLMFGQNLINNPSFESFPECPERPSSNEQPVLIDHWFSPTLGTPDLYSACGFPGDMHVPKNIMGRAEAADAKSYVGLLANIPFRWEREPYSEYITNELVQPLEAAGLYKLSFSARAVNLSNHFTASFSFALARDSLFADVGLLDGHLAYEQITVVRDSAATTRWLRLEALIEAKGGERFLTIGHFMPFEESDFIKRRITIKNQQTPLYYLYDDFLLERQTIFGREISVNAQLPLEEVYFAHDSDSLEPKASLIIDSLASYLRSHRQLSIELLGFADPLGAEDYNLELSRRRAEAVLRRLVDEGVEEHRLEAQGLGEAPAGSSARQRKVVIEFTLAEP